MVFDPLAVPVRRGVGEHGAEDGEGAEPHGARRSMECVIEGVAFLRCLTMRSTTLLQTRVRAAFEKPPWKVGLDLN